MYGLICPFSLVKTNFTTKNSNVAISLVYFEILNQKFENLTMVKLPIICVIFHITKVKLENSQI